MLERLVTACATGLIAMAAAAALAAAVAVPLPQVPSNPGGQEPGAEVELAHGCHRGILRDYHGWHFHSGACVRRNTPPPGLYDVPAYRRFYRGPLCRYQCRFIGPVKTCQQVCR